MVNQFLINPIVNTDALPIFKNTMQQTKTHNRVLRRITLIRYYQLLVSYNKWAVSQNAVQRLVVVSVWLVLLKLKTGEKEGGRRKGSAGLWGLRCRAPPEGAEQFGAPPKGAERMLRAPIKEPSKIFHFERGAQTKSAQGRNLRPALKIGNELIT